MSGMRGDRGDSGWATILPPEPLVSGMDTRAGEDVLDQTRVRVEVVTISKCSAQAEFRFRLDTVEVWYWEHCSAVFDRDMLRTWLTSPRRWVAEGEVVLSVDPRSAGDRIAISLPDVEAWTLSPKELAALRVRA